MYLLLYTYTLLAFDSKHGYRLKVINNSDDYVVMDDKKIRVKTGKDLLDNKKINPVVRIKNVGVNEYTIRFCKPYLTAKKSDPGIVTSNDSDSELVMWEFIESGGGYKIRNRALNQCLAVTDSRDNNGGGYYMNRRDCDESQPMLFTFLDAGMLVHFCEPVAEKFCENIDKSENGNDKSKNRKRRRKKPSNENRKDGDENSLSDSEYDKERPKKRARKNPKKSKNKYDVRDSESPSSSQNEQQKQHDVWDNNEKPNGDSESGYSSKSESDDFEAESRSYDGDDEGERTHHKLKSEDFVHHHQKKRKK